MPTFFGIIIVLRTADKFTLRGAWGVDGGTLKCSKIGQ